MLKDSYSFDELTKIIATLRGENGCPWDIAQTHESLKEYLLEEAYETLDAVDSGDKDKLCEELGDVLLQVMLNAQIGKDEGTFDINDVIASLAKKMIIRHPHVFADVKVKDAGDVTANWDMIKKKEKKFKKTSEILSDVPKNFPSLLRGQKISSRLFKSKDCSFSREDILKLLSERIDRLKSNGGNIEKEIGAVLFLLTALSANEKINPEMTLAGTINRVIEGFSEYENNRPASGGFNGFIENL